jgi:mRNA interferase HigB
MNKPSRPFPGEVCVARKLRPSSNFWKSVPYFKFVIGTEVVERHFKTHVGHKGIKATRTQYNAWLAIVGRAQWRTPEDVKASYPKASILKGSRVVFNIKGNDYRLIASIQYQAGVLAIRFFGSHAEYDKIDAESV